MVGAIPGWISQAAFWVLLLWGYACDELSLRRIAVFLFLWVAGFMGSPYSPYWFPFSSYVAILDIVLVFLIFKGDVKFR